MLVIYYIVPGKVQWLVLLAGSVIYYLLSGNAWLIVYPIASVTVCYIGIRMLTALADQESKEKTVIRAAADTKSNVKSEAQRNEKNYIRRRKFVLLATILLNIGVLVVLKYVNFGINTINGLSGIFGGSGQVFDSVRFLIPLGVSFYTFSLIGYVVDVYYGIAETQRNYFKLALYGMYFPVIISGPILKYREHGQQFFEEHEFDYRTFTRGLQRMLWGFFKKLVIAERLGILVDTVYSQYAIYPGAYIWIATICYAFQLYTDFSGCMDIVLGLSECFGIVLPENFQTPFFAKSVAEYWRRWHITLGVWMKDYVFYPILRTGFFTNLNKKWKNKFGKKKGKQYATFVAMFILWLTVGIWHGGDWKFVIGSGLLHWCYIVLEELLEAPCAKAMQKLRINAEGKIVNLVRMLRTFFLVCIGDLFFRSASVGHAFAMLKGAVSAHNLRILWNGKLFSLGLDRIEFGITVVSLLILYAVSLLQRTGSVRDRIAGWKWPLRWILWYALLFYVILLGCYGPGYSASEFIYQGF